LVDEDAAAFDQVSVAYKLPKATEADKTARTTAIDRALHEAAVIPMKVVNLASEVASLAVTAATSGNKNAASDAATAGALALGAAKSAGYNVLTNVAAMSRPQDGASLIEETRAILDVVEELAKRAELAALKRLRPGQ
jgi:formiminotetrahydrofolate cyclodeaminase